jgi:hypothetical protein
VDDDIIEGDELFQLFLSNPSIGTIDPTYGFATAFIADNDSMSSKCIVLIDTNYVTKI